MTKPRRKGRFTTSRPLDSVPMPKFFLKQPVGLCQLADTSLFLPLVPELRPRWSWCYCLPVACCSWRGLVEAELECQFDGVSLAVGVAGDGLVRDFLFGEEHVRVMVDQCAVAGVVLVLAFDREGLVEDCGEEQVVFRRLGGSQEA
ncbi:hypothetical protein [Streptomyces sp. NPDC050428]|uniref:hypothetical protein n=1 Tax=unclassified Streptomyces TaxID=2593676 RepID=UPI003436C2F5|nr:hypothetical protein OG705_18935 [Streptomyces sp. NBC_00838]